MAKKNVTNVGSPENDAKDLIESGMPYTVEVEFAGTSDLLFHAWSVSEVEAKANAAKGSKEKKTDNPESMVYRNEKGVICIPAEYFRQSLIKASKSHQDPRSPRKSMKDLMTSIIFATEELHPIIGQNGKEQKEWEFEDRRRVQIKMAGVTRTRPGFRKNWKCTVRFQCLAPNYLSPDKLLQLFNEAGMFCGVGDFRPTFGRYNVTSFKVL